MEDDNNGSAHALIGVLISYSTDNVRFQGLADLANFIGVQLRTFKLSELPDDLNAHMREKLEEAVKEMNEVPFGYEVYFVEMVGSTKGVQQVALQLAASAENADEAARDLKSTWEQDVQ